eukprot:TRINITY_DN1630_c0_g2_i6.p4 TRINITY_DN1630_c0_g2~~TRINITY_DN1630_c0_g2_i6.p4  ORF type:complete len:122 (+),score=31.18 TRINITY_DN1630_c0_g2_i6:123-488(+)
MLAQYVADKKVSTSNQLDMAIAYLKKNCSLAQIDQQDFEKQIGVGVNYTDDDINKIVSTLINQHKEELLSQRYLVDIAALLRELREAHPFADGAKLIKTFNAEIESLIGPQTEEDLSLIHI